MIERGLVHRIGDATGLALVLTNTPWNARMSSIGVVPVVPARTADHPHAVPLGPDLAFDPTRIASLPRDLVGEAVAVAGDEAVHALERQLADLLDLGRLLDDPPRLSRPPAGRIDYPRAGDVHYLAGGDAEGKRYVVLSRDAFNRASGRVLVARLTSRVKRAYGDIVPVADGASRVICAELAAAGASAVELRRRPADQRRLGLADRVAVARGIVDAFVLRDHLAPTDRALLDPAD